MISNAHYLTYFKGPSDIIFYSCGKGSHPDDRSVKAVAVYYPDKKNGLRTQLSSRKRYSRLIINGSPKDRLKLRLFPAETKKTLQRLFFIDPLTDEPMLRVPTTQVKEVYKPKDSLTKLLRKPPNMPGLARIIKDIRFSTRYLLSQEIPRKSLGLYGSFQCGIYHDSYINNPGDIDLLIYGLGHQKKIISLMQKHASVKYPFW